MAQMIDTFNDQQVLTPRVGKEAKKQLLRLLETIHRLETTEISVKNSDTSWNGLAALDGKRARQQVWEQAQDERTKPNFAGCGRGHSKPRWPRPGGHYAEQILVKLCTFIRSLDFCSTYVYTFSPHLIM